MTVVATCPDSTKTLMEQRLHARARERWPQIASRFDLISYQNGRKRWLVIPDEIEQTMSEYASQRIDIRAGHALISAFNRQIGDQDVIRGGSGSSMPALRAHRHDERGHPQRGQEPHPGAKALGHLTRVVRRLTGVRVLRPPRIPAA